MRVRGQDARQLTDGAGGRYAIAATGAPYPLSLAGGDRKDSIAIEFSDYGRPVDLTAPPKGSVVDTADLHP